MLHPYLYINIGQKLLWFSKLRIRLRWPVDHILNYLMLGPSKKFSTYISTIHYACHSFHWYSDRKATTEKGKFLLGCYWTKNLNFKMVMFLTRWSFQSSAFLMITPDWFLLFQCPILVFLDRDIHVCNPLLENRNMNLESFFIFLLLQSDGLYSLLLPATLGSSKMWIL